MASHHWNPSTTYTQQEKFLLKRLNQTRKLFKFLSTSGRRSICACIKWALGPNWVGFTAP